VASGEDPAERKSADRRAMTMAELCDLYLAEGATHKKPSTLKADRGRIIHHIKPQLGAKRVEKLTRADGQQDRREGDLPQRTSIRHYPIATTTLEQPLCHSGKSGRRTVWCN
jgi:hypothetical protein